MDRHSLLPSGFTPPSYRVALLRTSALQRLEADGLSHKAILVTAPPGYGKTALLAQWRLTLRAAGVRTAWMSLASDQTDPTHLLTYLAMSLIDAGIELGPAENLAQQWFADTPIPAAVGTLAGQLARDKQPIVLLVDDVHHLPRTVADQILGALLLPGLEHVHVALAGRIRPALGVAELRARGELLECDAETLRFTERELEALLPDLESAQRALLAARTQGWPVAVQLARLWLTAKPERVALIAGFSGRTTEVAEYLTEQVLGDLPPGIYRTLETTSPLDVLGAGVVEAITGAPEAWTAVTEYPPLAHLIVPLDDTREWYRLHPLLADYLRDRMHRRDPALERQCHAQASLWFEGRGMVREAIRHAILAGDVARAAAMVERTGGWELVLFGGAGLMRGLVAEIPTDRLAEFPRVKLFRAFLDAKDGALIDARKRYDEAWAAALHAGVTPTVATPIGRDLHIVGYLLARYEDRPVEPGALAVIYRDIDALADSDAIGRATLLNTACLVALALGDMRDTHEACDRAVREMRRLGSVLGFNYCALHLGLASLYLGSRREAEATFREAVDLAEENFGVDSGLRAVSDIHLAVALVARGEWSGALELFDRSLDHIETYDGWLDVYAEGYAAAIGAALGSGRLQRAEAYVERAATTAARRGLPRLRNLAAIHKARLRLRAGRLEDARNDLSPLAGRWPDSQFHWRERHAAGVVAVEIAIASRDFAGATRILADLAAAAAGGHRARDARLVAFLGAIAQHGSGARDHAAAALVELLEPSLREDDAEFLVESGALAVPLLRYARQWTRDHSASTLARQALGTALDRVATTDTAKPAQGLPLLSGRELEVLAELAQGSPNKVIARALQMTENTVKFHLKNIFPKLGVRHRAHAIRAAREQGLIR
jgi:LuxR family maltose regulon positive regulatory protein